MAEHYHPKSKGTWGREPYKTDAELNALCTEFFKDLKVPPEWRFDKWDNCFDVGIKTELHPTGTITSVGAIFTDMRTSGFHLKKFRIVFFTFGCRGGVLEITFDRMGKPKYLSVTQNKKIDALNEFIYDNYHRLDKDHRWWKFRRQIKRKRYKE